MEVVLSNGIPIAIFTKLDLAIRSIMLTYSNRVVDIVERKNECDAYIMDMHRGDGEIDVFSIINVQVCNCADHL